MTAEELRTALGRVRANYTEPDPTREEPDADLVMLVDAVEDYLRMLDEVREERCRCGEPGPYPCVACRVDIAALRSRVVRLDEDDGTPD